MATESGLLSSSDGGGSFTPLAFDGMAVHALVQDAQGWLFATVVGAVALQRSKDGGQSWEDLGVNTGLLAATSENELQLQGDRLMVYGGAGALHFSDDGGDTFMSGATIPGDNPLDVVHDGDWVYAVTDTGNRVVASDDLGQTWSDLSGYGTNANTVGVTPDGVLWVNEFKNLQRRSSDHGATFERERGLHNVRDMDIAYGPDGQRMVVAERGILRHSDAVVGDTGGDSPDAGAMSTVDGGTPDAGGMSAVDGSAMPTTGVTPDDTGASGPNGTDGQPATFGGDLDMMRVDEDDGCGCRTPGASGHAGAAPWLVVLALLWTRRRRQR
jgi:MYXO-CTERM domain-containing protein